ncbi:MAG: STAS domain-containing protein [Holosporales bacterium]|nr:STAS domain-containing protein [Holosporales bacterium]
MRRLKLYLYNVAPEILSILKNGYSFNKLYKDIYAGLVVAIISFPFAMALAIASGASPDKGLITSIVAGMLTSLLGGCKYQIGGPTGAFVVVIFNIIQTYGYDGLIVSTIMGGLILVICGLLRVGKIIQYIPYTVTAGFIAGLGITVLSTQLRDWLAITTPDQSGNFMDRIAFICGHISEYSPCSVWLGAVVISVIFLLQKYRPSWPRFLVAIAIGIVSVMIFGDSLETIGTRFTGLRWTGFEFAWPSMNLDMIQMLFPSAITIAFLAGVESLLCCTIADSLTNSRHKSDSELIGQGISNIVAAFFGGLPATGALARTAANIKAGAVSSFAGIFQSLFVCSFMYFFMEYMRYIPISCLAGMLVTIAWNMIGFRQTIYIFRASKSDTYVFLITLFLTVVINVTVAVEIGVLAAMFLFVKRLIERTEIQVSHIARSQPQIEKHEDLQLRDSIQCINIKGPLFFGLAPAINDILKRVCRKPEVIVLNLEYVPLIDATGARLIRNLVSGTNGIPVILTNLRQYPYEYLKHIDYKNENIYGYLTTNMKDAVEIANQFARE